MWDGKGWDGMGGTLAVRGSGIGGGGDKGAMGKGGSRDGRQQGWGQACAWHMPGARWHSEACPTPSPTRCALPAEDIRPSAHSRTFFPRPAAWALPPYPALRLLPAATQHPAPPPGPRCLHRGCAGCPPRLRPPSCPRRHHHPTHPASSAPPAACGPLPGQDAPNLLRSRTASN